MALSEDKVIGRYRRQNFGREFAELFYGEEGKNKKFQNEIVAI